MTANFLDTRLPDAIWSRLQPCPMTGCWLSTTAPASDSGHTKMWVGDVKEWTHRATYEALVGPVPEGLVLDHRCLTPACANPAHLEPVTRQVNTLRAALLNTHCPHGHPYSGDNLIERRGGRECRTCNNTRDRNRPRGGDADVQADLYNGRADRDVCVKCETPVADGKKRCAPCLAKQREATARYAAKKRGAK